MLPAEVASGKPYLWAPGTPRFGESEIGLGQGEIGLRLCPIDAAGAQQ